MKKCNALGTIGMAFLVALVALMGCESDAQHIRETNAALATPTKASTSLSAEIDSLEIQDGDCINSTLPEGINIESVVIVPCLETWQYRVLGSFEVADSVRYPGEDFFERQAFETCDRRYSYFLFPIAESWEFGDRKVNCLQESFGLSVSDPEKLDRLVGDVSLESGECYIEAPETGGSLVELVSCSSEWQYRVLGSFEVADSVRYPREEFFSQRAQESCDSRYDYFLFPIAESWMLGDREITCIQEQT